MNDAKYQTVWCPVHGGFASCLLLGARVPPPRLFLGTEKYPKEDECPTGLLAGLLPSASPVGTG